MSSDDRLAEYLAGAAQPGTHALDRFTHKVITNLLMHYCIPWLAHCLSSYSEAEFHAKMMDPSWDFITDWKINHADKYPRFINGARRLRHRFTFDVDAITERVVGSIRMQAGWQVYPYEYIILRDTIERVKGEIYA